MREDEILKSHTYVDCSGNIRQVISVDRNRYHVVYRELKGGNVSYSKLFLNQFSRWAQRDITYDDIKIDVRSSRGGGDERCMSSDGLSGSECGSPWCGDCGDKEAVWRARAETSERMLEFVKEENESLRSRLEEALKNVNAACCCGKCDNPLSLHDLKTMVEDLEREERERDEAIEAVSFMRRGIEAYRARIAANNEEELAAACKTYREWEKEAATRFESRVEQAQNRWRGTGWSHGS